MLIEFLRNSKREPIGCVVAIDKNSIGISLLNPKDEFDRKLAKKIAIGRAELGILPFIPSRKEALVENALRRMADRAGRYFKDEYVNTIS
jgi:hypothetical protein